MLESIRRIIEGAFLWLCGVLPRKLGAHALFLLRSRPGITDAWGYHVRPIHYYEPVPDFRDITEDQTTARRLPKSIHFDLEGQIAFQRQISAPVRDELTALASTREPEGFAFGNGYFSALDAANYYALLRHLKPATVIEVGCGYSTRIAHRALGRNRAENAAGKLVCIEPYPEERLTAASIDMELLKRPVQEVPFSRFGQLKSNDVLFIDSSHVATFGSDVCREILDILPLLQPGVWIHFHDIFFPTDYPAAWVIDRRIAFNEQYLLEAFLSFNGQFTPQCALRWLWLDHAPAMSQCWPTAVLPGSDGHGAASFWMKRTS